MIPNAKHGFALVLLALLAISLFYAHSIYVSVIP